MVVNGEQSEALKELNVVEKTNGINVEEVDKYAKSLAEVHDDEDGAVASEAENGGGNEANNDQSPTETENAILGGLER